MKKTVSLLLTLCLLFGICGGAVPAYAASADDYPVIIVPGYGASPLFALNEDGTLGEQVWGWNILMDGLLGQLKQKFPAVLSGAALLTVGSARVLGKTLGAAAADMFEKLRFNGSGESVYRVTTLPNEPALCRWDLFEEHFDGDLYSEKEYGRVLDDYVPESQIYNFSVDFRYGAKYNAERLNEFIGKVKAFTGKEKVNLFAVSHGGQVAATYLSLYGSKKDVNNALLTVPAIGGAYMAYDVLTEQVKLNEEELLLFIENALYLEQDFEWFLKNQPLPILDAIIKEMMPGLKQVLGYWESLWDFLPYETYKDVIASANRSECAKLLDKTADYHENVMKNIGKALRRCREMGINVNIIAGCGNPHVTGSQQNSDAIIQVAGSTGAKVAPFGQRFANGYVCTGTVCGNKKHNHLSPSMEIDASYAYLPENTWFVEGMFHGMTMNEPYAKELATRLLFTKSLPSVYADPAFPQFRASENMAYGVYATFNNAAPGYITRDSRTFTVTNRSEKYSMLIRDIRASGIDVEFKGDYKKALAPGESADFEVLGVIPEISAARAAVTVTFELKNSVTPLNFRVFRFTVDNGPAAAYDASAPYSPVDFTPPVAKLLPGNTAGMLQKLGLLDWLSMWYNIMYRIVQTIKALL